MTKFEIPTEAARPLYAAAGATDVVVGYVRAAVADVQKQFADVQTRLGGLDFEPTALREVIEARVADLQGFVAENATTMNSAYADLAKRGETLVGRIRTQESTKATTTAAKTTTAKAKTTRTQATKAANKTTTAAKKSTKATAKKATSTAKKTSTAPKASAKATTTAAKKTASAAAAATTDAAAKVGD
jgi:heparin binding hemagglutinin HbhA